MNLELEQLYSEQIDVELNGENITLKLYSLKIEAHLAKLYGSYKVAMEKIGNGDTETLFYLFYLLLPKKTSYRNFCKSIAKKFSKQDVDQLTSAVNKTILEAQPIIKSMTMHKTRVAISKFKSGEEGDETDYLSCYDSIAKRYGYSIEQFYELTAKQVHALMDIINTREVQERHFQMKLNGFEVKEIEKQIDVTEDQLTKNRLDAKELHKRMEKNYQDKLKKEAN